MLNKLALAVRATAPASAAALMVAKQSAHLDNLATKHDLRELELRLKNDLTLRLGGMFCWNYRCSELSASRDAVWQPSYGDFFLWGYYGALGALVEEGLSGQALHFTRTAVWGLPPYR